MEATARGRGGQRPSFHRVAIGHGVRSSLPTDPGTFAPGRLTDSRSEELMNDGSGPSYLRSETTLGQLSQRNIRSAGCVPELRWSAKCFICAPQPLQTRVGTSCVSGARSSIADPSQKKPKQMNDRKTDSPLCSLRHFRGKTTT
jgi:hypothetical protein